MKAHPSRRLLTKNAWTCMETAFILLIHKVDGLLYEYACHEGNQGMLDTLRGARQKERDLLAAEGSN